MLVERWEHTSAVTVPVLMTRNSGSILLRHADHLIAQGLPENFKIVECVPADRHQKQLAALKAAATSHALPPPPPPPADLNATTRMQNA